MARARSKKASKPRARQTPARSAKRTSPTPAKQAPKPPPEPEFRTLHSQVGSPPTDDTLAALSWMMRLYAVMAGDVLQEPGMTRQARRDELHKIADRMAKLRDPDRIYQAERLLTGANQQMSQTRRGPQTEDAPKPSEQAGPIAARRGRPPRSSIR